MIKFLETIWNQGKNVQDLRIQQRQNQKCRTNVKFNFFSQFFCEFQYMCLEIMQRKTSADGIPKLLKV